MLLLPEKLNQFFNKRINNAPTVIIKSTVTQPLVACKKTQPKPSYLKTKREAKNLEDKSSKYIRYSNISVSPKSFALKPKSKKCNRATTFLDHS